MAATKRKRFVSADGLLQCYLCKRLLAPDAFIDIERTDKRCKTGHSWTGKSSDCRECRIKYKREQRRKKAEAAGRQFEPRHDRAVWEARRAQKREERKKAGMARLRERNERQALEAATRASLLATSPILSCTVCKEIKDRGCFYASDASLCKECCSKRDRLKFKRQVTELQDGYVKRRIQNSSGLKWGDIPESLVQAERARLLLARVVAPRRRRPLDDVVDLLRATLASGPIRADELNRILNRHGASATNSKNSTRRRALQIIGAYYEPTTSAYYIAKESHVKAAR